jgi:hypothetical protein
MVFAADGIPLYNIFIMILIISANWMMALYPCRFRTLMTNNILLRHIFGLFTMLFFVVLTNTEKDPKLKTLSIDALCLYALFIILLRTPLFIFIAILILLGALYVLNIKKKEIKGEESLEEKAKEEQLRIISIMTNSISIISYILLVSGFFIYLGQKKLEYKNQFSYFTFMLGKTECKDSSPKTSYISGIMHAFD